MQNLPVSAGCVPGILGQGFAELAGVRKDMCRESRGQSFAEFAGVRRMCAGNPGTGLCRICRCPQGYVPGILGQSFAELAGVRKDMCRESGDKALRTSPESLACL